MNEHIKNILKRFKSPATWLAIIGLIYSTVLVPEFDCLPDWTCIVGMVATVFGITNNPTDTENY